jgi:oligosaccharide repeat unit polymerase
MYGIEDKILSIIFSIMILLIAVGIRMMTGTFLVPGGIFALFWFICTFTPLVTLIDAPINSLAILYILSAVLSYALSASLFNWRIALHRNLKKSPDTAAFDSRFLEIVIYTSAISATVLSLITVLINGFTIEQVLIDLIRTSGQYAAVRGTDGLAYGLIGILSIMFTYLCPVLAGFRFYSPRKKWFFIVAIFPSLTTMITQSSKIVFLVSLSFYLSGVLIAKVYAQKMSLPKRTTLVKLALVSIFFIPLILISFISRLGDVEFDNLTAITEPLFFSISSYMIGQIYAFADFFSFSIGLPSASNYKDDFFSFGAFTFGSIFDMLGIGKEFPPGMYDETGRYNNVFETNIFTFFRGLIYDFGIAGSLLFLFIFGIFSHAVMWRVLSKNRAIFSLSMVVAIHVFIFMGYLFSVFVARYVFLISCVIFLLLSINSRLHLGKNSLWRDRAHTSLVGKPTSSCKIQ